MARCPHCPAAEGTRCPAESHPRGCHLVGQEAAAGQPGYWTAWAQGANAPGVPIAAPTQSPAAEAPLPSGPAMAIGFVGALARHVAAGSPTVGPEAHAARVAACRGCDHFRPSDGRCGVMRGTGCGCPVDKSAWWADYRPCEECLWPT